MDVLTTRRLFIGFIFAIFLSITQFTFWYTFMTASLTSLRTQKLVIRTSNCRAIDFIRSVGTILITITVKRTWNAQSVCTTKLDTMAHRKIWKVNYFWNMSIKNIRNVNFFCQCLLLYSKLPLIRHIRNLWRAGLWNISHYSLGWFWLNISYSPEDKSAQIRGTYSLTEDLNSKLETSEHSCFRFRHYCSLVDLY